MTFRFEKLTNKSQSLLLNAESRTASLQNPEITPLHLLDAMLEESEGIMRPMLDTMGVKVDDLKGMVSELIACRKLSAEEAKFQVSFREHSTRPQRRQRSWAMNTSAPSISFWGSVKPEEKRSLCS